MTDLTYTTDAMFTRFIPETPAGETVWREMADQNNTAILNIHAKNVIQQIRSSGYKVSKAKKVIWGKSDDDLLSELLA